MATVEWPSLAFFALCTKNNMLGEYNIYNLSR
jgi:hypothetical protein